jgi:hypothetical protein
MYAMSEHAPHLGRSFRIRLALLILILLALAMLSFAVAPGAAQRERVASIGVPLAESCAQSDERVGFANDADFGSVVVTREGHTREDSAAPGRWQVGRRQMNAGASA